METEDQPLDNEPQDDTSFDDAFEEFAGGGGESTRNTDDDFEGGDQDRDDAQDDDSGGQADDDQAGQGDDADMTPRERELQAQLDRLRHSEASQRGRLGAYQRQINELQRRVEERQQATSPAPQRQAPAGQDSGDDDQQRQQAAEAMGADDWETFKEDFPDMARALEARLATDRQERAQLEQRLAQYEPALQSMQQQAQEEHLQAQDDALKARHPDWREVVAAPAFAEWLKQQPPSLQALTNSEDAAEAAALLDMYRAQTGNAGPAESQDGTPDKRQERLAAAQSPQRRGRPRQGQVAEDFDAAFDHYAAKKAAR